MLASYSLMWWKSASPEDGEQGKNVLSHQAFQQSPGDQKELLDELLECCFRGVGDTEAR